MEKHFLAGCAGLALACAVPAWAQSLAKPGESMLVTATRSALDTPATLRDTVVVTRDDLDAAGPITLAEALQRYAGVELRATGGPGQPVGVFMRGSASAQTLVLIDGMRVASATSGSTALEAIPLELIERIEVVKGPMSGLYGSDAIGGVVQVFTRGRDKPHLFGSAGYGSENDRRLSAGFSTQDDDTRVQVSAGVRKVDARSAANPRASFGYDPDRDPHENAWANVHLARRLWTGEWISLDAFGSGARTKYDGGSPADRSIQSLAGVRVSGDSDFLPGWKMRMTASHSQDRQRSEGGSPSLFETRQDQAAFINDFRTQVGTALLGAEFLRQQVRPTIDAFGTTIFDVSERRTDSYFASWNESWAGNQRVEANVRSDHDEQYGRRTTGAISYGTPITQAIVLSATYGRGFRVPSFNDLYLVQFAPFYLPNPLLRPERSRSVEVSLAAAPRLPVAWKVTAFDNRVTDLVTFNDTTVVNLDRARIQGLEASIDAAWLGVRWRAQGTLQRPRDEATHEVLRMRAQRHATLDASHAWGDLSAGVAAIASGPRYDAVLPSDATRVAGYTRWDLRARYRFAKVWTAELTAVNVLDRRYENALGYDAQRRGVFLSMRFDAF